MDVCFYLHCPLACAQEKSQYQCTCASKLKSEILIMFNEKLNTQISKIITHDVS